MDKINLINLFVEDHNVVYNWDEKDILTLDNLIKNEVRGERQEIFGLDGKPGIDLYYYSKDPFSKSKDDNIWVPKNIKKIVKISGSASDFPCVGATPVRRYRTTVLVASLHKDLGVDHSATATPFCFE